MSGRRWFRYALIAGALGALLSLVSCERRRTVKFSLLPTACVIRQPSQGQSVPMSPSDPCEWEGVCGTFLGWLLGCACEAGGGSSGAGSIPP